MVPVAGDYAWSSYRQRIGEEDRWIDLDPAYLDLADNESERRARYTRFVEQGVPEQELSLMREAPQRGPLTGNQRFGNEVEQIIGCRIERRRPGRPPSRRAWEDKSVPVFADRALWVHEYAYAFSTSRSGTEGLN